MAVPGIALQLYTVREDAGRDFVGTLRRVAEIGYPAVQFAGYGGLGVNQMKDLLDELRLQVAGSHIGIDRLESALDEEIEYNRTLGNRDIVVPAMPRDQRGTVDDFRRFAALLTNLGRRCKEAGARLSYHNHAFEFEDLGGTRGLDILLDQTDPSLVYFEPDIYWVVIGGEDPAALIRRYTGRCPIIHIKDAAADAERSFAEVGEGTLDFKPIFEASEAGGAEWYVVEQDRCARPAFESIQLSLNHLREWGKL